MIAMKLMGELIATGMAYQIRMKGITVAMDEMTVTMVATETLTEIETVWMTVMRIIAAMVAMTVITVTMVITATVVMAITAVTEIVLKCKKVTGMV